MGEKDLPLSDFADVLFDSDLFKPQIDVHDLFPTKTFDDRTSALAGALFKGVFVTGAVSAFVLCQHILFRS